MKLYEVDKQYNSKADLWEAIKMAIEPAKVKKINRLLAVIEKGHYIKM